MNALSDFIVSRVRVKLFKKLLSSPEELFYVRQLTRMTGEEINAVRRELLHMSQAGMVKMQGRGNRLYFWFNKDYRYYSELSALVAKSTGLGASIIKNKEKIGRINFAFISMRLVRKMPVKPGQVDLVVIGEVVIPQLTELVKATESEVGREINYSVMTSEEFNFRKRRRDPFLIDILKGSRIMLVGDEEELVS